MSPISCTPPPRPTPDPSSQMAPVVGQAAPPFEAEATFPDGSFKKVSLDSYKGKYVVLFFYPLDFTFVCPVRHAREAGERGRGGAFRGPTARPPPPLTLRRADGDHRLQRPQQGVRRAGRGGAPLWAGGGAPRWCDVAHSRLPPLPLACS